jgi:hypothetical protein
MLREIIFSLDQKQNEILDSKEKNILNKTKSNIYKTFELAVQENFQLDGIMLLKLNWNLTSLTDRNDCKECPLIFCKLCETNCENMFVK